MKSLRKWLRLIWAIVLVLIAIDQLTDTAE